MKETIKKHIIRLRKGIAIIFQNLMEKNIFIQKMKKIITEIIQIQIEEMIKMIVMKTIMKIKQ